MTEYQQHLDSYTEGNDPLAMQEQAPIILMNLIKGAADTELRARPAE